MAGMDVEELIAVHPQVFHTMSATAWPSRMPDDDD